jgi:uncharacterized protein DUF4279
MLCLMITGFDGEPSRISEILGLTPTQVSIVGQPSPGGRRHRKSGWHLTLEAPIRSGEEHQRLLDELLSQISRRQKQFAAMRAEMKPETVSIYGGLHFTPDEQTGLWLTQDQMRVLVECGIEWGLDIFNNGGES